MTNAAVLEESLTAGPTGDLVDAVSRSLDEPPWLRQHRLSALRTYEELQWPSGQEEEWRRTPLSDVPLERYRIPLGRTAVPTPDLLSLAGPTRGGLLAHVDNAVTHLELSQELERKGVLLAPLSIAAREHEPLVRAHLNTVAPIDYDRFTALSAALWTQGLFCYVPRGVVVEPTLYHLLSKSAGGLGLFGHTLIVAAEGSAVTMVEAAATGDEAGDGDVDGEDASLVNRTVEIVAQDEARVQVVQLQQWGRDVSVFLTERASLGRYATVLLASAAFGARLHKERVEIDATGAGSRADLIGLFVGTGDQHIEFDTRQRHTGVGSSSDLLIKGALDDNADAVQYGLIKIYPSGQKTRSSQTMRNLLLSEGAGADPIPILEIEADDVKCSHAAAVGPVDPEHLFYLQSRGIDPDTAERMVVHGFLQVAVERLPDAHTREVVERAIEEKLHTGVAA